MRNNYKKHKDESKGENRPQPVNAVYLIDRPDEKHTKFMVKVLKNMLYARPEVKEVNSVWGRKLIEGKLQRPFKGGFRLWYDKDSVAAHMWRLEYHTKGAMGLDEETLVEYSDFSFATEDPEYNFFNLIEKNWNDDVAAKEAERKKKKFAKLADAAK